MVHALQKQVDTLQEQLHQTSQNSSRGPSGDDTRPSVCGARGVNAVVVVNRAILAIPAF